MNIIYVTFKCFMSARRVLLRFFIFTPTLNVQCLMFSYVSQTMNCLTECMINTKALSRHSLYKMPLSEANPIFLCDTLLNITYFQNAFVFIFIIY